MNRNELNALRDSLLAEIKQMMLTTGQVTQYIGARYVPVFANPIEWDEEREYEPLTVVMYQGDSYTSRQFVPKGIRIADAHYWALTGNYNAQIEQYREEVRAFDDRITNAQSTADSKAPIMHSSSGTVYGLGAQELYGHVKLTDSPSNSGVDGGTAATPKMVQDVRNRLSNMCEYNILDYRESGDTGYTEALKRIANLVNTYKEAAKIKFPVGKFEISDTVTFDVDNLVIEGSSDYVSSYVQYTGNGTLLIVNGTGLRVNNIAFIGVEDKTATAIDVRTSSDCDAGFNQVYFQFFDYCVKCKGRNVKCTNCTFDNAIHGIKIYKPADNEYRVVHISDCRFHAMVKTNVNDVDNCCICIDIECDANYANSSRAHFSILSNDCDTASNCVFLKCPDIAMAIKDNTFTCNNIGYFIYMPSEYAAGKSIQNNITGNNNVMNTNTLCYFLFMASNTPTVVSGNCSNNGAMYIKALNRTVISSNLLMLATTYNFPEYLKVDSLPSAENVISANSFIKATTTQTKNSNNTGVVQLMKSSSNNTSFID